MSSAIRLSHRSTELLSASWSKRESFQDTSYPQVKMWAADGGRYFGCMESFQFCTLTPLLFLSFSLPLALFVSLSRLISPSKIQFVFFFFLTCNQTIKIISSTNISPCDEQSSGGRHYQPIHKSAPSLKSL